jgi:hypothetical protein
MENPFTLIVNNCDRRLDDIMGSPNYDSEGLGDDATFLASSQGDPDADETRPTSAPQSEPSEQEGSGGGDDVGAASVQPMPAPRSGQVHRQSYLRVLVPPPSFQAVLCAGVPKPKKKGKGNGKANAKKPRSKVDGPKANPDAKKPRINAGSSEDIAIQGLVSLGGPAPKGASDPPSTPAAQQIMAGFASGKLCAENVVAALARGKEQASSRKFDINSLLN